MDIFSDETILGDHKKRKIDKDFEVPAEDTLEGESILADTQEKRKFFIFYGIVFLVFIILVIQLWSLQIIKGVHFRFLAEGNRIRTKITPAPRGIIYASNGQALVSNIPSFVLEVNPQDLPSDEEEKADLLKKVSQWSEISYSEISEKINAADSEPLILAENIEREKALILKEKLAEVSGISVEERITRQYLVNSSLSHTLGYVGKISKEEYGELKDKGYTMLDLVGKTGLESFYQDTLKGESGKKQVEVDATGKVSRILAQSDPIPGANLVLTLDVRLQQKMHQVLNGALENTGSPGGAVVAINPQTGGILGIVTLPTYDNNIFTTQLPQVLSQEYQRLVQDPKKPLFNRAISGIYPPGSTIKMLVASAGLQENVIGLNTYLYAPEAILIPNKYDPSIVYRFPDWKPGGHGYVNVISAIAKSSDVFFYAVGGGYEHISGLGIDRLYQYFTKFGLGQKSGIDLVGEHTGLAPNPEWKLKAKKEDWYFGDTYHVSIGQGDLLVTPLQLANYVTVVANGGTLLKPHLVWKVQDSEGNITKEYGREVKAENIIDPYNLEIVRRGMREAVTSGTARELAGLTVSAAGKTGTAQFDNNTKTHAWFAAFAPYDNPEIVLVVLVEGGGEGHESAAPIAREILQYYFARK